MNRIQIDFRESRGPIKPMHAVNNGPTGSMRSGRSTGRYFLEAGIPFARNHDASLSTAYGGEFTVDVHRIFRDFDADETDPASYDFEVTDQCVAATFEVGTEVFYRLGAAIEHGKKYGTYPPRDFAKWARICEHIIRHYTEGWANGFEYPIRYWEIWNEPECGIFTTNRPCWQGTMKQFTEFFVIALTHLKKCFPHLKIGGPAFTSLSPRKMPYFHYFLKAVKASGAHLDFFSFHRYTADPDDMAVHCERARTLLDEEGFFDTETVLNEWNYVCGWRGEAWTETIRAEQGLKGAAFVASSMCTCQKSSLDLLMYYDARLCAMNGMFHILYMTPLKGYYPFRMFGDLYRMGQEVASQSEKPFYTVAARGQDKMGAMISCFLDQSEEKSFEATLSLKGLEPGKTLRLFSLDEERDQEEILALPVTGEEMELPLSVSLYSTLYLSIEG